MDALIVTAAEVHHARAWQVGAGGRVEVTTALGPVASQLQLVGVVEDWRQASRTAYEATLRDFTGSVQIFGGPFTERSHVTDMPYRRDEEVRATATAALYVDRHRRSQRRLSLDRMSKWDSWEYIQSSYEAFDAARERLGVAPDDAVTRKVAAALRKGYGLLEIHAAEHEERDWHP